MYVTVAVLEVNKITAYQVSRAGYLMVSVL